MPMGVVSERLNGHDDSRNAGFLSKSEPKEFRQTFCRTLAGPVVSIIFTW
jgi:hypothetical protein